MGKIDPKDIRPDDPRLRDLWPYDGYAAALEAERIVAEAERRARKNGR
jgi:hypothetical protein